MDQARRPPRFGEEDRKLSYGSYLRLPELLSLQISESDPPAHDELLFITVHQVYELWFQQVLFELDAARDRMFAGDLRRARHLLRRVHAIEKVGIDQIPVLETMSPQDFLEFRTHLAPASGFQSVQFREIEIVSGRHPGDVLERVATTEAEAARLQRRLTEPDLWDAFCAALEQRGLPMPREDAEVRRSSLATMARDRDRWGEEFELSEDLLTHDQLVAMWRSRHVLMVERQIGTKSGTGGSTGAPYLRTTLDHRFFPELWELRNYL